MPELPPPSLPRERTPRADVLLTALVVAFAFLAASFEARNSDLWRHLAAGRLVARGDFPFGADPFAYTTADAYWANHAWLSDLALYGTFEAFGGAGLVVLKAAAVALLAAVMLRASRGQGPFWVAAGCVLLALLATTPRLLLQPKLVSLLLLGICLHLLRTGGRAAWAVPAVVALWANLDGWFVLGPVLAALAWVGRRVIPADARPVSGWVVVAGAAACLVTPYHVRGLTPPPELSPAVWSSPLLDDPRFVGLLASPWQAEVLFGSDVNLAAWAYVGLVVLGVTSFAVNWRAVRGWRGLVWLVFAGLAAWQVRLAPFFAVVAGPISALNLREAVGARGEVITRAGQGVVVVAAVGLIVLTWPGWLQGVRARDRQLAWGVHTDPTLRHAAETVAAWRASGALRHDARVFGTHPDVSHYLAWFAPGERGFLDSRVELFTGVANEYRAVETALNLVASNDVPPADAERVLGAYSVGCVVVYDPSPRWLASGLRSVVGAAERWRILEVAGEAILVERRRAAGGSVAIPTFDPEREAFGSGGAPPAPPDGPPRLAQPSPWWQPFPTSVPPSLDADLAVGFLGLFEAPPGGPAQSRPPDLLLLAARAARRAVATTPDDPRAWLALARAYPVLNRGTWEADVAAGFPLLRHVRDVQSAAALVQAITADPDSAPAHLALAGLFAERGFLDLSLRHRRTALRLNRRAGRLPGEAETAFAERVRSLAEATDRLEVAVQDSENRFLVRTDTLAGDPLAQARIAVGLGLAGRALDDVLLKSHPDLYGTQGLRLLLELLLSTGRAGDAHELLDRDEMRRNPEGLGFHDVLGGAPDARWGYRLQAHGWFDFCQAAATGRYGRAADALARLRGRLARESAALSPPLTAGLAWRVGAEVGLGATAAALPQLVIQEDRRRAGELVAQVQFLAVEQADLHTLEGVLLIEQGRPAEAARQFDQAEAVYSQSPASVPARPGRLLATRYRDALRTTSR